MVRKLPVLQTPAGEDAEAEARPAWQWILIGVTLTLLIFFPTSMIATWLGARLSQSFETRPGLAALVYAGPVLASFVLAAGASGAFVGRFGRRAGLRSVALLGALSGGALILLAGLAGALSPISVALGAGFVLVVAGVVSAYLGSEFGRRRRP